VVKLPLVAKRLSSGRISFSFSTDGGHIPVKLWSNCSQTAVKRWPNSGRAGRGGGGQTLVKHWSNCRPTSPDCWAWRRCCSATLPPSSAGATASVCGRSTAAASPLRRV
jgi:hypothetical protein